MKRLPLIAALTAGILTAVLHSGLLAIQNLYLSDLLYQREEPLDANIFILGIDEAAIENLGPYQTWPRTFVAQAIEMLNADPDCRPAAIGVDVLYVGRTDIADDRRLAEACAAAGNVIMAARAQTAPRIVSTEGGLYLDQNAVVLLELPYPELLASASAGHISTYPVDADGVIRYAFQYIDLPPDLEASAGFSRLQSFDLAVYRKYAGVCGLPEDPGVPSDRLHRWLIPYSAKPGGYSDGYSLWDLLSGDLPPEIFEGSIVLIGPYTVGLQDQYATPADRARLMYGVEIHANIIDAMVRGVYRENVPGHISALLTFCVLLLLFAAFYVWNPLPSALLLFVLSGGYLLTARQMVFPAVDNWFLFGNVRYQLPPLYLPLGAFLLYIGLLVFHFLTAQRQRRQVTDMFKKYVDPAIIEDIFRTGIGHLQLGGRLAEICVMFVDIRGFTPMSELMQPEEVVLMLNDYLEMTSTAIFKHNGTLDKFIGDATMAFWGAPFPQDDIAYKAALAAWDIAQSGLRMADALYEKYGHTVNFGIGLHLGEAVVGNIGTAQRVDYTAIGNTVNTAARLESNARPGQILLSEAVYRALEGRITARNVGNVPLKGKSEELTVYALEHIREYEGRYAPLASAKTPLQANQ